MKKPIKKYSIMSRTSLRNMENDLLYEVTRGMNPREKSAFLMDVDKTIIRTETFCPIILKANCSERARELEHKLLLEKVRKMDATEREMYLHGLACRFAHVEEKGYIIR